MAPSQQAKSSKSARGLLTAAVVRRLPARGPAPRRQGAGPGQAAPSGAASLTSGRAAGRPAGRAGLLGPAAAAGTAGPVAPDRDPLPDRDRLSAVQLYRRRRQSGRLQRRSRPRAVRGDQGHLHGADAPLRDAGRCARLQPGRRHHRLDGGEPAAPRPGRLHRSLLPRAGALRLAQGRGDAGDPARISRGQEGRRHRRLRA